MAEKSEKIGRKLTSEQVGDYTLLNSEKLRKVLDMIEGIAFSQDPVRADEDKQLLEMAKRLKLNQVDTVLAMYDREGGGVKLGERKVIGGAFYNFMARELRKRSTLTEDDFADEEVLVPKKKNKEVKRESATDRIKRLGKSADEDEKADESEKKVEKEVEKKAKSE